MYRTPLVWIVTASLLRYALPAAAQLPPSSPEEPMLVYVYTDSPGEPKDGNSVAKTVEEIGKRVKDHKKWFRVVAKRDEADIAVEVVRQMEGRGQATTFAPRNENQAALDGDRAMTGFLDVGKAFTVETRLHVSDADPFDLNVVSEGKRPRDVARPYAQQLERFCRFNYWILMEALEK